MRVYGQSLDFFAILHQSSAQHLGRVFQPCFVCCGVVQCKSATRTCVCVEVHVSEHAQRKRVYGKTGIETGHGERARVRARVRESMCVVV